MALGILTKQFDRATRARATNSLRALEKVLGPAWDLNTELRFLASLATDGSQGGAAAGAARVIKELDRDLFGKVWKSAGIRVRVPRPNL